MKLLTKLTLTVATLSVLGASAALADDPQLPNRLAMQQAQNIPRVLTTTVAVYTNAGGLGRREVNMNEQAPEVRFELRSNPHGQVFGLWVEAR